MPEVVGWKEEAQVALEEYKTDAWREWAPEWLVPSLFEVEPNANDRQGMQEVKGGTQIDESMWRVEVEAKYKKLQDEVAEGVIEGIIDADEAVKRSQELEKEREREMEKRNDFARWEKGDVDEDEVEELSEEEVRKVKAKTKGKGKEKEKEEEKTKKPTRTKRRRVEDSEGEEEEKAEIKVAPRGWRPSVGATVRSIQIIMKLMLIELLYSKCDACKRERAVCALPNAKVRCKGCAIKRKVCLWEGKRIAKGRAAKGEVKEVKEIKDTPRGSRRPTRTASAPGNSQKWPRIEETDEEEEEEIRKEMEAAVASVREGTRPSARPGA